MSLARMIENLGILLSDYVICVSKRMLNDLKRQKLVSDQAVVLYDAPRIRLRSMLEKEIQVTKDKYIPKSKQNAFSIITSTSYTPDEDISMLVTAVDEVARNNPDARITLLITGKGPMKDEIAGQLAQYTSFQAEQVFTSADDYLK